MKDKFKTHDDYINAMSFIEKQLQKVTQNGGFGSLSPEDAAELQLQQDHVVRLETRPPSMEGTNAVSIRDLIKNALRMRPDRAW